jgi:hypothetical protein
MGPVSTQRMLNRKMDNVFREPETRSNAENFLDGLIDQLRQRS